MRLPARRTPPNPAAKKIRLGRGVEILRQSATAIHAIADSLDEDFLVAVDKILSMRGCLIVCGIGKAGLVGRKLSATFASTGTRSHFLHPSEAVHGDMGCVGPTDVVLILSNSGSTEEVVRILPYLSRKAAGLIAMTSSGNSPLARAADIALILPPCREACQHNLAPSTSTTSMLALGDALALVVSEVRGFSMADFAELHPGGALGKRLTTVDEAMRSLTECRVSRCTTSVRDVLVEVAKPGRRTGAVMLVDEYGKLQGIFTDSDLAKLLEQRRDEELDRPVHEVMTKSFSAIRSGARLKDAIDVLVGRKISELPVVDADDKPMGLIDVTDVLELEHLQQRNIESGPTLDPSKAIPSKDETEWEDEPRTLRIFGPRL
jgi:arabinose-5-phosphate isomerase